MADELSYCDLDLLFLFDVIDPVDYILLREVVRLERKSKKKVFQLSVIPNDQCIRLFHFDKINIMKLCDALKLPKMCRTAANHRFSGLEGLCILLARLSSPVKMEAHVATFGRSPTALSRIFRWMLDFIYYNYSELLRGLDQKWMNQKNLEYYAQTCNSAGCPLPNIAGFIDSTSRPICRPSRNHRVHLHSYKHHVIKYQAVILPNGLIGRLDGAFNGSRHDNFMLNASGLLRDLTRHWIMKDGSFYRLYGVKGYKHSRFIAVPYKGLLTPAQEAFTSKLNSVRQNEDYGFNKVINLFPFVGMVKQNKILLQPVNKTYIVAVLLANCHSCFYGNQVAQIFNCQPLTINEYLG